MRKYLWVLLVIFIAGVLIRFINFKESIYFGYDEARDAFDSQNIYLKGDLKISGPPASVFRGINHGPVYLYLIGPLFILDKGDPYIASAVFRIMNALGILGVAFLSSLLFGNPVGIIAAAIYAFSFEQYQYAIFTGNPAVSNIFWIILFLGAGIVYKLKKRRNLGLFLMFFGAASIAQFDLILSYSFLTVFILLFILRKKIQGIPFASWLKILFLGLLPIYSYPIAEIKNHFLGIKTLAGIISTKSSILSRGENLATGFLKNFSGLFSDNVINTGANINITLILLTLLILFLIIKAKREPLSKFILIWIGSIAFLLLTRGFMPLYSYAGVGIGVIIGASLFLTEVAKRSQLIAVFIILIIVATNITRIYGQSKRGLVVEIKAQPGMMLADEIKIVQKTYEYSAGKAFTIRTTSMPYKIQTVWAYLYNQYGLKKYGYLPYLEGGNVLGYPGKLPEPIKGLTCVRFLIREPVRGIPEVLINNDVKEENVFSDIISEETVGQFLIQYRKSKDTSCHNIKPTADSTSLLPNFLLTNLPEYKPPQDLI